jgi:predicted RNA polymerase sigma factor
MRWRIPPARLTGHNERLDTVARAEIQDAGFDRMLRELAPQVLGALVRRQGRFDACEDAVQEALLAAALQWPVDGVPDRPRGWLIAVASRRLIDELRSEQARKAREHAVLGEPTPSPGEEAGHPGSGF